MCRRLAQGRHRREFARHAAPYKPYPQMPRTAAKYPPPRACAGLALNIFLSVLPPLLYALGRAQGAASASDVDFSVVSRYFLFQARAVRVFVHHAWLFMCVVFMWWCAGASSRAPCRCCMRCPERAHPAAAHTPPPHKHARPGPHRLCRVICRGVAAVGAAAVAAVARGRAPDPGDVGAAHVYVLPELHAAQRARARCFVLLLCLID